MASVFRRQATKVRFDLGKFEQNGSHTNDIISTIKVQAHEENGMMERSRKPLSTSANRHIYQPQYSTGGGSAHSPTSPKGVPDVTETETRYVAMIHQLKDELAFVEESNSNLLVELRESQDANYVLTEELRRIQRSNINTLDELQACQTANTVLRQELQRLEQASVRTTKDMEKFKKANKLLREEVKELKSHQLKRKNSFLTVREKAKDLQNDLLEKEKNNADLGTLKNAINIIVDTVEAESLSNDTGYFPTDSDTQSTDGGEESLEAFTPKVVRKERFAGRKESPLASPIGRILAPTRLATTPDYKHEQNGLFGRRHREIFAEYDEMRQRSRSLNNNMNGVKNGNITDTRTSPERRIAGRMSGSLNNLNKEDTEDNIRNNLAQTSSNRSDSQTSESPTSPDNLAQTRLARQKLKLDLNGNLEARATFAENKSLRMLNDELLSPNTWQV